MMAEREPQWPASLALLCGAGLLVSIPEGIRVGPSHFLIAALEAAAALAMIIGWPDRLVRERAAFRYLSIGLIAFVTVVNMVSLGQLVDFLLNRGDVDGADLVRSAVAIWGTNVIAFGCWYWEIDGGGPYFRRDDAIPTRDFLFAQMTDDGRPYAPRRWYPQFVDYLYLSFTNSTAFSPTDTLPLRPRAKFLMALQSIVALVTIAVVAARAVNILR